MLTMQMLLDMQRLVQSVENEPRKTIYPTPFHGVDVICDHHALADTTERAFQASRHRSKRIHKKLVKRYGGEFKKTPAIFTINGRIIAHPARYAELKEMFVTCP